MERVNDFKTPERYEISEQGGVTLIGDESFFDGLIHAAVGSSGGFGPRPLKRFGLAANAASSVTARFWLRETAVP